MKLSLINEVSMSDIGHGALDVAGFVPGFGEAADLTNAIWYAKNGEYASAVLSLISMIPEIGDVVAKGIKYLGKGSKLVAKIITKFGPTIEKHWPKIVNMIEKTPKYRKYARIIDREMKELQREAQQTQGVL